MNTNVTPEELAKEQFADMDTSSIPAHMQGAVELYILYGFSGGGFLDAIVMNDLKLAESRADLINQKKIMDYHAFFHHEAPDDCWGSRENVVAWEKMGGLVGYYTKEEPQ